MNTWQNDKTGTTESNQLLAGLIKVINIISNLKFEYLASYFMLQISAIILLGVYVLQRRPVSDKREACLHLKQFTFAASQLKRALQNLKSLFTFFIALVNIKVLVE